MIETNFILFISHLFKHFNIYLLHCAKCFNNYSIYHTSNLRMKHLQPIVTFTSRNRHNQHQREGFGHHYLIIVITISKVNFVFISFMNQFNKRRRKGDLNLNDFTFLFSSYREFIYYRMNFTSTTINIMKLMTFPKVAKCRICY